MDPEGEIAQARLIWKAALMVNRFTEGEQEVRAIMVEVMAEEVGIETAGMVIIVKTDSNRITEIWKSTKNTQSRQTQKVLKSVFLQKFIKIIRRKICEKWNKKKYLVVNIKKYIKINISEIKITRYRVLQYFSKLPPSQHVGLDSHCPTSQSRTKKRVFHATFALFTEKPAEKKFLYLPSFFKHLVSYFQVIPNIFPAENKKNDEKTLNKFVNPKIYILATGLAAAATTAERFLPAYFFVMCIVQGKRRWECFFCSLRFQVWFVYFVWYHDDGTKMVRSMNWNNGE